MAAGKTSRILYDGQCGVCKRSIQFVRKHDRRQQFEFFPLQSAEGKALLTTAGFPEDYLSSVVLINQKGVYTGSDALVETLRKLNRPWNLLYSLKVIPHPIREFLYYFVAKKARHWRITRTLFPCNGC